MRYFLALLLLFAEPGQVSLAVHTVPNHWIECHVPLNELNRELDIIIEDVSGVGYDLTDEHQRVSFSLDIPQPLECPGGEENVTRTVNIACELLWFDLLNGKMKVTSQRSSLVCQP